MKSNTINMKIKPTTLIRVDNNDNHYEQQSPPLELLVTQIQTSLKLFSPFDNNDKSFLPLSTCSP